MATSRIIVAEEKHYTRYLDASTDEALARSALALLTERFNAGYWYSTPDAVYPDDSKWSTSLKQLVPDYDPSADKELRIAALETYKSALALIPDEEAKKLAIKNLNQAIRRENEKREYTKWYNEVKNLVESQDWQAVVTFKNGSTESKAWRILSERSDAEYEHVTLEKVEIYAS